MEDGAADQAVRIGSLTERGCCRPLVVQSQVLHQDLVPCNEPCASMTDQKKLRSASAEWMVRTSFPTIGPCCGLCGEKDDFPTERERERKDLQPARADGTCHAGTAQNKHHSYRRAMHRGIGVIRGTQQRRCDCRNLSPIYDRARSRHGHWRQQQRKENFLT